MDKFEYNKYQRIYQLKRYHLRKEQAIIVLGGKCVKCGSTENLEFDHVDPTQKSFTIAKLWSVSKTKFEEELSKCQILCSPCHYEKTRVDNNYNSRFTHGTHVSYRHNHCRCQPCINAAIAARNRSKRGGVG